MYCTALMLSLHLRDEDDFHRGEGQMQADACQGNSIPFSQVRLHYDLHEVIAGTVV
jgi:hypothetical protein